MALSSVEQERGISAVTATRSELAYLKIRPVLFTALNGGSQSKPTRHAWGSGSVAALNRAASTIPYDDLDVRIAASNGVPIPRQVSTYSRWLHLHQLDEIFDAPEFTEAQVTGVTSIEVGHDRRGRRHLPVFNLLDVAMEASPTYSIGAADLAYLIQNEAADLVVRHEPVA